MIGFLELIELVAATVWFWTFSIGFLVSIVTSIAIFFCPTLWWTIILYAVWIWYDRNTCETGGRPCNWVRQSLCWRFTRYYFSHKVITNPDVTLNPKKNYLFACFPHGILPFGPFGTLVDGYQTTFTEHKPYTTALSIQFWLPFIRELFLAVGSVSVSGPSIKYLLGNENGGNIVSIVVGGGDEGKYSRPGKYKIILNKRKGFIKMALQTGSPLVPVMSFGETDIFDQLDFPGFACIREAVKKTLQIGLVIPKGRFLICPNKVPVVTVVGDPIDVDKVEQPTPEQIDALHQRFVDDLKKLFEDYKHRYAQDPENTFLEIV